MRQFIFLSAFISMSVVVTSFASAQTLIVGNKREHTVSFINLDTGEEVTRTKTGKSPHEVAVSPDGKTAVIVSYRGPLFTGNKLHIFDVETGEKRGLINLGAHKAPHGLKWIGDSNRVIATTEATNDVVIVDVEKRKVVKSVKTDQGGSHMVALSPDLNRAYVANINGGNFSVIDLNTHEKIRDVEAGVNTEAISVTPDGKEIWVGNNGSRSIIVFDANTYEKRNEIKTEGIPIRVEISPDGAHTAVSEADLGRVSIYDVKSRERTAIIDLSTVNAKVPVTLLFAPDGSRLWVAATGSAKIVEVDTADWSILRTLPAGEGSDGLGYSPLTTAK